MKFRSVALAAILAAAMTSHAAHADGTLQIASSNIGSSDTAEIVALQLGYFKDAGLNVTIFDAGGGNNAVASVVGGSADLGLVSLFNASKPAAKGQPIKVVGVDTVGFGQYLFVRTAILNGTGVTEASSMADKAKLLRGKTIAVNDIGGSSGQFVRQILAAGGFAPTDAKLININSPAARLTALKAGRIDAIVGSPPEPEASIVDGYGTMLLNPNKDIPGTGQFASSVEIVRTDFLAKNGALLARYEAAVQRGRNLIQNNPDQARQAYYAYIQNEGRSSILNDKIEKLAFSDMLPTFAKVPTLSKDQYAASQKFFHLPATLTYENFVDNSIADQVGH